MSVRAVHHLNAGTMCPLAGGLLGVTTMVCHCLVIETERDGLIVVDTGFSTLDVADPRRITRSLRWTARPTFSADEPVAAQLGRLGFTPTDVRHVVITHLDLDHAGGLIDFPGATVHLHGREHAAAMARSTSKERSRYLPSQWAHDVRWHTYDTAGDTWRGLPAISRLAGVDADVGLLPLHGHTRGHSGVLVRAGERWLVHAGDAYYDRRVFGGAAGAQPRILGVFEKAMQMDRAARLASIEALRALRQGHADVEVFSAHDQGELAALAGR